MLLHRAPRALLRNPGKQTALETLRRAACDGATFGQTTNSELSTHEFAGAPWRGLDRVAMIANILDKQTVGAANLDPEAGFRKNVEEIAQWSLGNGNRLPQQHMAKSSKAQDTEEDRARRTETTLSRRLDKLRESAEHKQLSHLQLDILRELLPAFFEPIDDRMKVSDVQSKKKHRETLMQQSQEALQRTLKQEEPEEIPCPF